jgi:hypothetical protein
VNSLAKTLKGLKYGAGKDQYVAKNIIEAAMVSSNNIESLRATKSCLGMNRRTIKRSFERRKLFNS